MPSLGADMDEGTLLEWLVHPGDTVSKGDVVAVVDTAKAAVEVECFTSGVVDSLLVEPGTTVAVGTPLAVIGAPSAAEPQVPAPRPQPEPARPAAPLEHPVLVRSPLVRHEAASHGIDLAAVHGSGPGGTVRREDVEHVGRPRVSPYAARLATERGVDLARVAGSGPYGTIHARDLDLDGGPPPAAPAPRPVAAQAKRGEDPRVREAIARLMSRSKREVPHYYLRTEISLQRATAWLHDHNLTLPVTERLVPAALLLAATARAAMAVPQVNGFWEDDAFTGQPTVHLGVAVSLRAGGMVTPAIHDAQDLALAELMAQLRDLVARGRNGRLRASELTDATLTVTNLGDRGVDEVLGVIYPPQVALVGFGTVRERPWAVDGLLGVHPVVTATLSADHRATDGYVGARFLNQIDAVLQRPEEL
jgi:pyruvate dehydrogenase E2 component (dihydrolipoamide acetyltransferase)